MKKLLFTVALVFGISPLALAQPEAPSPGAAAGSAVDPHISSGTAPDGNTAHGTGHHDPSEDFRYLGSPFGHGAKDVKGGKLGDGVMLDKHGNVVRDEHGHPAEEEPMSAPFIYMVLNFALLLFLLMKYGAPIAKKTAADRHDQIKTALDEAAKLRKQAADKLAEYESRLKDADAEIRKMVEGMRTDAEADKARILANAERQSVQMQKDAEQRIAAEIEYARTQLTKEVTAAATKATEDLLRKKMVPSDQQKLITSFISDIGRGGSN